MYLYKHFLKTFNPFYSPGYINMFPNWKNDALKMIELLKNHPQSQPFHNPVDEVNDEAPNYYTLIEHPMDLSTLRLQVTNGKIDGPFKYHKIVESIWQNAFDFNGKDHPVTAAAKILQNFSKKLIQKYWCKKYGDIFKFYPPIRKSTRLSVVNQDEFFKQKQQPQVDISMNNPKTNIKTEKQEMEIDQNLDVFENEKFQGNFQTQITNLTTEIIDLRNENTFLKKTNDEIQYNYNNIQRDVQNQFFLLSTEITRLKKQNEILQKTKQENEIHHDQYQKKLKIKISQLKEQLIQLNKENHGLKQQLVFRYNAFRVSYNQINHAYNNLTKIVGDLHTSGHQ